VSESFLLGMIKERLRMRRHEPIVDTEYIAKHEGLRLSTYKDPKGFPTIGIGHKITTETPAIMKQLFGRDFDAESVVAGKRKLSKSQAFDLFRYDIEKRVGEIQKAIPRFATYPQYLRTALLDGWFRGDLPGSPRTLELIRNGDFATASVEYVNHDEFRSSPGIARRMEKNALRMYQFSKDQYERVIQIKLEEPTK